MTNFTIDASYWWLLLILIPGIALTLLPYLRMNKRYRRNRNRVVSMVLHLVVLALCVFTLAGVTFEYDTPNVDNEILILLDSSHSSRDAQDVKEDVVTGVLDYGGDDYKVGIVKFGYDQVYAAPLSNDSRGVYRNYLASAEPDTSATDIASALTYASGLVANPSTAKIVLVSDGVETDGNAMSAIRSVAAQGTMVDVVPLTSQKHNELQIMGVDVPETNLSEGVEFELGLRLKSNFGSAGNQDASNKYEVTATLYDNGEKMSEHTAFLKTGDLIMPLTHTFAERGLHELKIEVSATSADGNGDTVEENNTFHTYIFLAEYNKVLLLEKEKDESKALQKALFEMGKEVTPYTTDVEEERNAIPVDIADLAEYDQVVLVNIANSDMPTGFSATLYDYVNRLGGGLFTVGGKNETVIENGKEKLVPHAYNRADMADAAAKGNPYYQQLLPVQAVDYTPPVAIVALIDTSGSMSGKIGYCKNGANHLLGRLKSWDYFGVSTFADKSVETMRILPATMRSEIVREINNISEYNAGSTSFASAVNMAAQQLNADNINAPRKHIIFFTDGQPGDYEDFAASAKKIYEDSNHVITVSVAVTGTVEGGNETVNKNMTAACEAAGGKYLYSPTLGDYSSLAFEDLENNVVDEIHYGEEYSLRIASTTTGITKDIKQEDLNELKFTGYYGTRLKDGAQAPIMAQYVPMYAHWSVGKGRVGSFMCDMYAPDSPGAENWSWAKGFLDSEVGKQLLTNIFVDTCPSSPIPPPGLDVAETDDNYSTQLNVYTEVPEDGKVEVTVTPESKEAQEYYNGGNVAVESYDGNTRFTFDVRAAGVYKISVRRVDAQGNTVGGVYTAYKTLAYSEEYNVYGIDAEAGAARLASIADATGGIVTSDALELFDSFVKYLHKTVDPRLAFLIIAIVLFLLDIAVRKFKFKWIHELIRDRKAKKALQSEPHK